MYAHSIFKFLLIGWDADSNTVACPDTSHHRNMGKWKYSSPRNDVRECVHLHSTDIDPASRQFSPGGGHIDIHVGTA